MTQPQPEEPPSEPPGRVRTWWHPLLVNTLRWALGDAYEVRDEVSVGRMPLQIDIVLLRRVGEPPEIARRELAPLLPILNEYTLLEFKGPTDALGVGDLDQLLGCVHLFRSQQRPPLERGTLSVAILAPTMTAGLEGDAGRLGFVIHSRDEGIWEIAGSLFPLWVFETDRLALSAETVLALFSHAFLQDPKPIIEHWKAAHHAAILGFILQQIQQFKNAGESFVMQHKDTQVMEATWEDVENLILSLSSKEKRLASLSPEERLEGLAAEERLRGLSEQELKVIKQLVEQRLAAGPRDPEDA